MWDILRVVVSDRWLMISCQQGNTTNEARGSRINTICPSRSTKVRGMRREMASGLLEARYTTCLGGCGARSFPQSPHMVGLRCCPVLSEPQAGVDYLRGCDLSQPRPWISSFESRGYVRECQSCTKVGHIQFGTSVAKLKESCWTESLFRARPAAANAPNEPIPKHAVGGMKRKQKTGNFVFIKRTYSVAAADSLHGNSDNDGLAGRSCGITVGDSIGSKEKPR
jgi:hypothetical protein